MWHLWQFLFKKCPLPGRKGRQRPAILYELFKMRASNKDIQFMSLGWYFRCQGGQLDTSYTRLRWHLRQSPYHFIYTSRDLGFPAFLIATLFSLINLCSSSASKSFPLSQREKSYWEGRCSCHFFCIMCSNFGILLKSLIPHHFPMRLTFH